MNNFLKGVIIGLIAGFFIPNERTVNNIKKLKTKGDNSPIDADFDLKKQRRKLPFLKRLIKRRKKDEVRKH